MQLPSKTELHELVAAQNFKCALSGVKLTPETACLDHIVSRNCGGDDSLSNLQALNVNVNRMKHTLSNDEFVAWCHRIVDHSQ